MLWQDYCGRPGGDTDPAWVYAKSKFDSLSPILDGLLEFIPSKDPDGLSQWLWPKGRIEYYPTMNGIMSPESPWECAIREFSEETQVPKGLFGLNDISMPHPVSTSWYGSNNKNYASYYFILVDPVQKVKDYIFDMPTRTTPIREVSTCETSEVKWVSQDDLSVYMTESSCLFYNSLPTSLEQGQPIDNYYLRPADNVDIDI
jgi:8-oxo-dGTP pyrophosphatase MutT (NUDIX family)